MDFHLWPGRLCSGGEGGGGRPALGILTHRDKGVSSLVKASPLHIFSGTLIPPSDQGGLSLTQQVAGRSFYAPPLRMPRSLVHQRSAGMRHPRRWRAKSFSLFYDHLCRRGWGSASKVRAFSLHPLILIPVISFVPNFLSKLLKLDIFNASTVKSLIPSEVEWYQTLLLISRNNWKRFIDVI